MRRKHSQEIIGRESEKKSLKQFLNSKKAEFLAVYGRRRVGKTFLIKNFFEQSPCILFRATGIQDGILKDQLQEFSKQIGSTFYSGAPIQPRARWLEAFEDLTRAIEMVPKSKKIVLFLDEFPWMATKRSKLLQALEYYWNHYWGHDPRIKLIICGSSASWVIEKIINNKGGLYNRVTRAMRLSPFTLYESKAFLESLGFKLNQKQVLDLYMVLGGIPHYLALMKPGSSAKQCIDELFFQKDGPLVNEFERLFDSLFHESEAYVNLICIIAEYRYGIGQAALLLKSGLGEGGRAIQRLKELEEAGFILSFLPHGNREKGIYYKVIDEYTLFYLAWIKPHLSSIRKQDKGRGYWLSKSQSPSWKSWSGYAFESICIKHLAQIRSALGIEPSAEAGAWRYISRSQTDTEGAQIDLLFDRPDSVITICEIKYSDRPFILDKAGALNMVKKVEIYRKQTRTQKQIFLVMITSSDLKPSRYSEELISEYIGLSDLFKPTP